MVNPSSYREHVPGLPNLFSGEGSKDPLAVTLCNVTQHLVGWMSIDNLAKSMGIVTRQAKDHLRAFLIEHNFAHENEGTELWSNFHVKQSHN